MDFSQKQEVVRECMIKHIKGSKTLIAPIRNQYFRTVHRVRISGTGKYMWFSVDKHGDVVHEIHDYWGKDACQGYPEVVPCS